MSIWRVILPWLIPMAVLIIISAFFSGSEAALVSLRSWEKRALKRGSASSRVVARLLDDPERLLSAILFWNLMINVMYFGIASIVGARIENAINSDHAAAVGFTVISLLALIFFSEMLPKSIAVVAPLRVAQLAGPLLVIPVRIVSPVLPILSFANLVTRRILWPGFQPEPSLDLSDIERAVNLGTDDAALAARERNLLQHLMQMADTRATEWMRPRSQLQLESLPAKPFEPGDSDWSTSYRLFAEPKTNDVVAGVVYRFLRPSQIDDLEASIETVLYAPWSSNVSHVFDQMLKKNKQIAAIVNEYGETIGILTLDDIVAKIFRDPDAFRSVSPSADPIARQVVPGVWHASGSTSARWLAKQLQIETPKGRNVTLAGVMQQINERVPRLDDTCTWAGYRMTVIEEDEKGNLLFEIQDLSTPGLDRRNEPR